MDRIYWQKSWNKFGKSTVSCQIIHYEVFTNLVLTLQGFWRQSVIVRCTLCPLSNGKWTAQAVMKKFNTPPHSDCRDGLMSNRHRSPWYQMFTSITNVHSKSFSFLPNGPKTSFRAPEQPATVTHFNKWTTLNWTQSTLSKTIHGRKLHWAWQVE